MTKKMFDLILIEFLLLSGALGLWKCVAARHQQTDSGLAENVASAVVGL